MDNKDIQVLGTLKKEKSSKPLFVIIVFLLLIGTCIALPDINDKFDINTLLKPNTNGNSAIITNVTTTTTTTQKPIFKESLECNLNNNKYLYSFNKEGNLSKIQNEYLYNYNHEEDYNTIYYKFLDLAKKINSLGGDATITEGDDFFKFNVIIDRASSFNEYDVNYFDLGTLYERVENNMTSRGYECK